MADRCEVRLSGAGGQGLILAGQILAEAASVYGDQNAIQSQSYGPEARGGKSKSDVILSSGPIDYPKATAVDILLALTPEACRAYIRDLKPGGTLLIDLSVQEIPPGDFTVHSFPILATAGQVLGNSIVANIVALGFLNRVTGLVSPSALESAVLANVPAKARELNRKALRAGYEPVASLSEGLSLSDETEGPSRGFRPPRPHWKTRIGENCLDCGTCQVHCPVEALGKEGDGGRPSVNDTCINCGHCDVCPVGAIRLVEVQRPLRVSYRCMDCRIQCHLQCPQRAISFLGDRRIDQRRCNGCLACLRACPVPSFLMVQEGTSYRLVSPERYREKCGFKAPAPSWKARINDDCLGCHLCIGVCPVKAIEAERDQTRPSVKDTCINCGHCERHCPNRAIRPAISRRPSKVTESCMFCEVQCHKNCPVGAISSTADRTIDQSLCIGCLGCISHCPLPHRSYVRWLWGLKKIPVQRTLYIGEVIRVGQG